MKELDFRVPLDVDREAAIQELAHLVNPSWNPPDIRVKLLAGGYINILYKVWQEGPPGGTTTTLVVRVFSHNSTVVVPTTETLAPCMVAAHKAGLGAEVRAVFSNGIVYDFQPGEIMSPADENLNNEKTRRLAVTMLARFHQVDATEQVRNNQLKQEPRIHGDFKHVLDQAVVRPSVPLLTQRGGELINDTHALVEEVQWAIDVINNLDYHVTFSHGDSWWGNMVYEAKTDTVNLIDYELAGFNYFAIDLARFLAYVKLQLNPPAFCPLPIDEENALCRVYLEEVNKIKKTEMSVSDNDVQILHSLVMAFKMYNCLYLFTACLALAANYGSDAISLFAIMFEGAYHVLKDEYLARKKDHPEYFVSRWKPK